MPMTTASLPRPAVEEIKDAYNRLFRPSASLSKIKDAALGGRLFPNPDIDSLGVVGRSLAWKLFLLPAEPLQSVIDAVASPPFEAILAGRAEYKNALLERMRAPDGSYEDGLIIPGIGQSPPRSQSNSINLERNNPLSLDDENPWTEWFAAMDLRKTILQDVQRTFPDIAYFRDSEIQAQLANILFVYSVAHPDIGYRQGMHELLACLYYAVDYDSIPEDAGGTADDKVKEFCARTWVAADAWGLFSVVMRSIDCWYEWQESASEKQTQDLDGSEDQTGSLKPFVAPIVQVCDRIQSMLLKSVDPELWRRLQSTGIEPQIYGIRWLRLLFTREFPMRDVMLMWDALFATDPTLELAEWICVAMLIRIRNQLIPSDYTGQLTYLLRYPAQSGEPTTNLDRHYSQPCTLLVRQALTMQMSPTQATGVSIVYENRNLLSVPLEVPQPPPPPSRKRPPMAQRVHSASATSEVGSHSRFQTESSGGRSFSHARQSSNTLGLPEMFARGLLEKGESLGINKTVMSAVSELKRNLPDLTSSLTRLPGSQGSSDGDYPLEDERSSEERSWDMRARLEAERKITELRSLQRRLGDSVAWIVDALSLDENDSKSEDQKKDVQLRKHEALESLSYVRDILRGNTSSTALDEARLISGEEARKRKQANLEPERAASPPSRVPVHERLRRSVSPGQSATPSPLSTSPPRNGESRTTGWRGSSGFFPTPPVSTNAGPPKSVSPTPRNAAVLSSTISARSTLTTPNGNGVPLAPRVHTATGFSPDKSPFTTLPRLPSKTSAAFRLNPNHVPPVDLPQGPPTEGGHSRDQAPRNLHGDPLGVLP